jgi:hypothetical protein
MSEYFVLVIDKRFFTLMKILNVGTSQLASCHCVPPVIIFEVVYEFLVLSSLAC